jgi:hypothetical protein
VQPVLGSQHISWQSLLTDGPVCCLHLLYCAQADADNSGQLSRKEFKEALKAAELGLTRKDINLILSQVSE